MKYRFFKYEHTFIFLALCLSIQAYMGVQWSDFPVEQTNSLEIEIGQRLSEIPFSSIDPASVQSKLQQIIPQERGVRTLLSLGITFLGLLCFSKIILRYTEDDLVALMIPLVYLASPIVILSFGGLSIYSISIGLMMIGCYLFDGYLHKQKLWRWYFAVFLWIMAMLFDERLVLVIFPVLILYVLSIFKIQLSADINYFSNSFGAIPGVLLLVFCSIFFGYQFFLGLQISLLDEISGKMLANFPDWQTYHWGTISLTLLIFIYLLFTPKNSGLERYFLTVFWGLFGLTFYYSEVNTGEISNNQYLFWLIWVPIVWAVFFIQNKNKNFLKTWSFKAFIIIALMLNLVYTQEVISAYKTPAVLEQFEEAK